MRYLSRRLLMSEASEAPLTALTAGQVDEWIQTTTTQYLQLYLEVVASPKNPKLDVSIVKMALLFQEAIGKVRAMSDLLWSNKPTIAVGAAASQANATWLREKLTSIIYR